MASLYLIRNSIFCSFCKDIHESILVPSLFFSNFLGLYIMIFHWGGGYPHAPSCPPPLLWTTYLNKTIFNSFKRNFTCGANIMSLPLSFPFDKNVPYLILLCPSTSGYGLPSLPQTFVGSHLYPVGISFVKMSRNYLKEIFCFRQHCVLIMIYWHQQIECQVWNLLRKVIILKTVVLNLVKPLLNFGSSKTQVNCCFLF